MPAPDSTRSWMLRGALALVAALAACGGDTEPADPDAAPAADATPSPTWTNFAGAFFETYCHECHGPGDTLRDYSQLAMVRAESDAIRCGVSSEPLDGCSIPAGQFPVGTGPKPSDAERAELVRWIDEGAVE